MKGIFYNLMSKKGNYLDKTEFLNLIIKYQKNIITKREILELGKMILSLVNHIAMKPNFSNYTYLDEMKSTAIAKIWKGLNTFNIKKTDNAFSYFTVTAIHAFIFVIKKEKKIAERNREFSEDILQKIEMQKEYRFAKKVFSQELKERPGMFND